LKSKEKAPDRTAWKSSYERFCGPVTSKSTWWWQRDINNGHKTVVHTVKSYMLNINAVNNWHYFTDLYI